MNEEKINKKFGISESVVNEFKKFSIDRNRRIRNYKKVPKMAPNPQGLPSIQITAETVRVGSFEASDQTIKIVIGTDGRDSATIFCSPWAGADVSIHFTYRNLDTTGNFRHDKISVIPTFEIIFEPRGNMLTLILDNTNYELLRSFLSQIIEDLRDEFQDTESDEMSISDPDQPNQSESDPDQPEP